MRGDGGSRVWRAVAVPKVRGDGAYRGPWVRGDGDSRGWRVVGAEDERAVVSGRRALRGGSHVRGGTGAIGQVMAMWVSSQLGGQVQRGQVQLEVSLSMSITVPWLP